MLRKLLLITYAFIILLPVSPTKIYADTAQDTPDIIITEIYADAPGSPENGEFIELYNTTSDEVDLSGYALQRKSTSFLYELTGYIIEPESYLAVDPSFALVNSGGTIILEAPSDESGITSSIEVTYPSLDEQHSWSLVGDTWQKEAPTPGESNPLPLSPELPGDEEPPMNETLPDETPAVEEAEPLCSNTVLFINEIMANPKGDDKLGGEYIELYNGGTAPVSLSGCELKTDKLTDYVLDERVIEPGDYYAVYLSDKLLNNGGGVTLITSSTETTVEYPKLGDDEAWALLDKDWKITKAPTPGSANIPTPPVPSMEEKTKAELEPCSPGKERNPDTNRCRNIVLAATTLLPCGPGELRNAVTNRCRKISVTTSSLAPCRTGYERNPETNRCRQVKAASSSSLVPCQTGYERNPDTNRCRKTAGGVSGTASFPVSGPAPLHPGILISLTLLAFAYGLYEYRFDIANLYSKLQGKFTKPGTK
jgi:hypothetical protein